jgi:hypothetical protein
MDEIDERDAHQVDGVEEGGTKKGMTRRSFLGHAAVGAAAVSVGSGLLGVPAAMAGSTPTKLPKKWTKTYDVVVIGTGVGLAAAIEAKRAGASVAILEAADHIGGLYITAGGSFSMGGNNVVQQAAGVVDNNDAWFADEMYCTGYRAQPELVRTLVENGADTVKWFQDLGIKYAPISAGVLRPPIKRGITALQDTNVPPLYPGGQGTKNTGISFTMVMYNEVKRLKIPVLMQTKMTKIYRNEDGIVCGVRAKQLKDGKGIDIKARRGVVVCAGTWTDNDAMMQQYDPRLVGPDCYGDGGTPFDKQLYTNSAGDGIRQSQAIGAAVSDMSYAAYVYIFFGGRSYWGWGHNPIDWTTNTGYASGKAISQSAATFQSTMLVANNGKRYVNESTRFDKVPAGRGAYSENPEMPYTDAYLSLPQPRNVWMIADSTTAAALAWPIGAPTEAVPSTLTSPDPKVGQMFDPACIAIANTIPELAAKMGVDAANLEAEIAKYNGFVDAGVDADFGKPSPKGKVLTAPFYGLKASLIRHTQRNGLRCNTKMQVIEDKTGWKASASIDELKTIPQLYVAGESGNIFGWKRTHNTLAHYITAAIIAGRNCAKKVPAVK